MSTTAIVDRMRQLMRQGLDLDAAERRVRAERSASPAAFALARLLMEKMK